MSAVVPTSGGGRWRDYVFGLGGDADALLCAAGAKGEVVFVCGDGFDPRALHALRRLADLGVHADIVRIPLPRGSGRGASTALAVTNRQELEILASRLGASQIEVALPSDADRLNVGSRISRQLVADGTITADSVVIVDISALPSRIFFPIIGTLLELARLGNKGELLVTVSENPDLDERIRSAGVEDAGTITGFTHGFSADPDDNRITLWAPVLGEASGPELEAIYELLQQPEEIYPILPFPARDPRRGDDLVLEHRRLIFDRFEVEPRNILYVSESNPFDVYRALTSLYGRYTAMLGSLARVQLVTSTHASKMLAVGVCLAAWESSLPVVTAAPSSYGIDSVPDLEWVNATSSLCCLWLQGTPYR